MANFQITPTFFSNLKLNRVMSNRDIATLALHLDRTDLTNPAQTINTASFFTNYGVADELLLGYLRSLEAADQLVVSAATSFNITWADPAIVSPFTQTELVQQGTVDSDTKLLYALMIAKTPNVALQAVTANQFAAAPYEISAASLLRDVVSLGSNDRGGLGAYFTVDLTSISVTWLVSPVAA